MIIISFNKICVIKYIFIYSKNIFDCYKLFIFNTFQIYEKFEIIKMS